MVKVLRFQSINQYRKYFLELIDLEREEEMRIHRREIETLSASEREKKGNAITSLKLKKVEEWIQGKKIAYFSRNEEIKETNIKEGDMVLVSIKDPLKEKRFSTVKAVFKNGIALVFDTIPKQLYKRKVRVDLYVNEVTYNRMKNALRSLSSSHFPITYILGNGKPKVGEENPEKWFNPNLNDSQKKAVSLALGSTPLFLIHGPPGTGKTTTLTEYILQEVEKGRKVLVCADSNTAVDNIMEKVLEYTEDVVRVGNPVRISSKLLEHTLDYKLFSTKSYEEMIQQIKEKEKELSKYIPYSRKNAHGLGKNEVLALAKIKRRTRRLSIQKIKSMAKYIKLSEEIKALKKMKREVEIKEIKNILSSTPIVFSTNSTAGIEFMEDIWFDVVVIDEATQATEPSTLIPLIKGKKVVLAGDHKQLPPTILSEKAKEKLQLTLFERWISIYPESSYMLNIQYRMREKIASFPNRHFYGSKLISHNIAKQRTLTSLLPQSPPSLPSPYQEILEHDLVFINHKEFESRKRGSTSIYNKEEAEIVKKLLTFFLSLGIKEEHIGVITPYDDQVEYLKKRIKNENIEIKTVDGFQGREKEIIIISFVRSNLRSSIGFLEDIRRLNVSITRAKRKLILIGNLSTLSSHPLYKKLIEHIKKEGVIIESDEL